MFVSIYKLIPQHSKREVEGGKQYIDEKMGRDVTRKMSLKYELPDT